MKPEPGTDIKYRLKKSSVLLLLVFFAVCISVSGCSGRKRVSDKTKIEFWTISLKPTYEDYINGIIEEFEKDHSGVEVEWIDMPQSVIMQKLMASIAGGVSPDVVNLNPGYTLVLAQNNALVNMDKAVSQDKKDQYFKSLWESSNFEGASYGIPWYVTTRVIIYNSEIFRKASLDPDDPPQTRNEVEEYSRRIRENTDSYGYMPSIKIFEDFIMEDVPLVSEDRKKAVFDNEEGIKILKWYVQLKKQGLIPTETLAEGYTGALNRYQSGNLAMVIAGPTLLMKIRSDAPDIYEKTRVAPMPLGIAKIVPASTMNLVVPRASKHKELAVEFALFVTNNRHQLEFCKLVPLLPSTKKAARDEFFQKGKGEPLQDEAIRISINQLEYAKDMSLGLKDSGKLSRIMHEAVEAAYYDRKSVEEALSEAEERWNKILRTH